MNTPRFQGTHRGPRKSRQPAMPREVQRFFSRREDDQALLRVGMVIQSVPNLREHPGERMRRVKAERTMVADALLSMLTWRPPLPLVVRMIRLAPSKQGLDFVNLCHGLKASQDELAHWLKRSGLKDDADPRVTWGYEQCGGQSSYGLVVHIYPRTLAAPWEVLFEGCERSRPEVDPGLPAPPSG